jgi:hypothetical protein
MAIVLSEDCEGSGVPTSPNVWTNVGTGTIDWEETSVVGQGSQSLRIVSSATNDSVWGAFTAKNEIWCHFMWRWSALGGSASIFQLRGGGSLRCRVITTTAGVLTVGHGSTTSSNVADAVPADTWVHVWVHYALGSGANGVADVEWSTTTTRVGSGTKFQSVSTGTSTTSVDRFYCGAEANETQTVYFDQMLADDATYPSLSTADNLTWMTKSHVAGSVKNRAVVSGFTPPESAE